jgi:glucokinase
MENDRFFPKEPHFPWRMTVFSKRVVLQVLLLPHAVSQLYILSGKHCYILLISHARMLRMFLAHLHTSIIHRNFFSDIKIFIPLTSDFGLVINSKKFIMRKKVIAGIDIGGTNTRTGLVDHTGEVLIDSNIATKKYRKSEEFVSAIQSSIELMLNSPDIPQVELIGIGVGAPSANYHTGNIEGAVNLRWKYVPLTSMLNAKFPDIPIKVTNDANAAAIAEMVYGDAKNLRDFIVITLGTGLGSGIVANGELIYGHDGFAGEVGHITAVPNGRQCNCGRRGCLETYASAQGIRRTVFELLATSTAKSSLRKISFNKLTSEKIYIAALANDPVAIEAFQVTGEILGRSLADAVAFTSPSVIFLSGGLAEAKEKILNPTKENMEKYLVNCYKNKVEIKLSALGNKGAGIVGGAALIWRDFV